MIINDQGNYVVINKIKLIIHGVYILDFNFPFFVSFFLIEVLMKLSAVFLAFRFLQTV